MRVSIFAILILISTSSYVVASFAATDEALPIAPKRSDDRDALPTTPFVSLTGQDPFLPEDQERSNRAIANTPNTSHQKPTLKSVSKPTAKPVVGSKGSKSVSAKKQKTPAKILKTAKTTKSGGRKPASPSKKVLPKKGKP